LAAGNTDTEDSSGPPFAAPCAEAAGWHWGRGRERGSRLQVREGAETGIEGIPERRDRPNLEKNEIVTFLLTRFAREF
jgi:hypothetical protein